MLIYQRVQTPIDFILIFLRFFFALNQSYHVSCLQGEEEADRLGLGFTT